MQRASGPIYRLAVRDKVQASNTQPYALPATTLPAIYPRHRTAPTLTDLKGIHEVAEPFSKLNPPDRHEILKRLQIVASQLRGESVMADGSQTFVIQGYGSELCGGTGNCSLWVFDSQHTVLLKTIAQQFRYLSRTHNGKSDLLTTMHGSATESDLTEWRFDGHRYRPTSCGVVNYADIDGNLYHSPRIIPSKCD